MSFATAAAASLDGGGISSCVSTGRTSSRRNETIPLPPIETLRPPRGIDPIALDYVGSWPLSHIDFTTSPPSYKSATAPSASTLAGKRPTKVAMLPLIQPSGGFQYLDDKLHVIGYDHLSVRGSKGVSALPGLVYGALKCYVNTRRSSQKPRYTDETGKTMVFTPLDAIGPGEVEVPIETYFDWTRDWDSMLSVRGYVYPEGCERSMWDACLYFNGMSPQGCATIPWNDPSRTQRLEGDLLPSNRHGMLGLKKKWLKFTWKFCERSDHPRWGASITLYYEEYGNTAKGNSRYGSIPALDNPWPLLNPDHALQ